jgi:hypothetical protein
MYRVELKVEFKPSEKGGYVVKGYGFLMYRVELKETTHP